MMRLYFVHGGKQVWFSSWLQAGAFPIILLPIACAYFHHSRTQPTSQNKLFFIKPYLFIASAVIGILTGFDNYLYAYGVALLPFSTSSLVIASQLAFTAWFAFVLVKQNFTSYYINDVLLLTIGAGVLALHTSGNRPSNELNREFALGFLMTLGASALYGFILPLVELTGVCTIGMLLNNDFKVIPREAREYELGETNYYVIAIWTAIIGLGSHRSNILCLVFVIGHHNCCLITGNRGHYLGRILEYGGSALIKLILEYGGSTLIKLVIPYVPKETLG
ncbi:Purine permease 3 [Hibiscus syriacus]|uniref:Purine permease 3 n=1 Tax=Hibiscus syriacus TaxID=106335 RepID=A0A6A3AJZ9_HIBSY|nr:Purine permease 3 [Hibiscus syriacus]